jgi:hypothetical protein
MSVPHNLCALTVRLLGVEQLAQMIVAGDAQNPVPPHLIHEIEAIDPAVDDWDHLDAAEPVGVLRRVLCQVLGSVPGILISRFSKTRRFPQLLDGVVYASRQALLGGLLEPTAIQGLETGSGPLPSLSVEQCTPGLVEAGPDRAPGTGVASSPLAEHCNQLINRLHALEIAFGRWNAADVRSILAARPGTAYPRAAGEAVVLELRIVPVRPRSDYGIDGMS